MQMLFRLPGYKGCRWPGSRVSIYSVKTHRFRLTLRIRWWALMSLSIVGLPIDSHDTDAHNVALVATEWGAIGALAAVSTAPGINQA